MPTENPLPSSSSEPPKNIFISLKPLEKLNRSLHLTFYETIEKLMFSLTTRFHIEKN